ncbi:MAG: DUF92 domain-containing protein [Chloroflexota bacterium]
MSLISQLGLAFVLSALIAGIARWRRSLTNSGAIGALISGTAIFGFGGWAWGIILGFFFVSSTVLSHFKENEKKIVAEKFEKGHQRDLGQVIANGGLATVLAIFSFFFESPIWLALFVGAMATVTADTWATELGTLSKQPPRLITTGKPVPVGTSGGISLFGTAVSLLGGLAVGLIAGLTTSATIWQVLLMGGFGGLAGSLFDSLLGATVQAVYYSDERKKETEKKVNPQGIPNQHIRGWLWMTNDLVNLFASIFGGIVSLLIRFQTMRLV